MKKQLVIELPSISNRCREGQIMTEIPKLDIHNNVSARHRIEIARVFTQWASQLILSALVMKGQRNLCIETVTIDKSLISAESLQLARNVAAN